MRGDGAAIGVIEAGYRLDAEEGEWLRSIVEAARPLLDAGLGVWGFVHDVSGETLEIGPAVVLGGASSEVFRAASAAVPPRAIRCVTTTLSAVIGKETCAELAARTGLTERFGILDAVRTGATDPAGFGVGIGAPLPTITTIEGAQRRALEQVAAHLHTALRARRRRALRDEAVLEPDGRLVHAEGDARSSAEREALRRAAVEIDRARASLRPSDPEALGAWRAMVRGRWTLVDRFERDGRRFLVARPNAPGPTPRGGLSPAETTCALYAAMGHSGKLIAYELGIAESTVSTHLRSAMRKLGVTSRAALASAIGPPG